MIHHVHTGEIGHRALDIASRHLQARGQLGSGARFQQRLMPRQPIADPRDVAGPHQYIEVGADKTVIIRVERQNGFGRFNGTLVLAQMATGQGQCTAPPFVQPATLFLLHQHALGAGRIAGYDQGFGQPHRVAWLVGTKSHHQFVQRQTAAAIAGIEQNVTQIGQNRQFVGTMRAHAERHKTLCGIDRGIFHALGVKDARGAHPIERKRRIGPGAGLKMLQCGCGIVLR